MNSVVVHDGEVYHKSHAPTFKATVVADNSELQRMKQQSVRQSKVAYVDNNNNNNNNHLLLSPRFHFFVFVFVFLRRT